MKELSLSVLDLAQNAITAGAKHIDISLLESLREDSLRILIGDDGCGMSPELLARVTDPFTTTRTTRRVGMGIPLMKLAAEAAGGGLTIDSAPGKGTRLEASFRLSSIDRPPVGDMAATVTALIQGAPERCFRYLRRTDGGEFRLSTDEVRETLGEVGITEPEVLAWLRDYILEGEAALGAAI